MEGICTRLRYISLARPGFIGTPEAVKTRLEEFAAVGVDVVLLQSSPQAEEIERFAAQVIAAQ